MLIDLIGTKTMIKALRMSIRSNWDYPDTRILWLELRIVAWFSYPVMMYFWLLVQWPLRLLMVLLPCISVTLGREMWLLVRMLRMLLRLICVCWHLRMADGWLTPLAIYLDNSRPTRIFCHEVVGINRVLLPGLGMSLAIPRFGRYRPSHNHHIHRKRLKITPTSTLAF